MAWDPGSQQASGNDFRDPIFDGQFDWSQWTLPSDIALGQRMDSTVNPQIPHGHGFESFDLNFGASSAQYSFGDHSFPTQIPISQQETVDPSLLFQRHRPTSETDSTTSSFEGHSSGFGKHSSTFSLGTYSTNSSSYSQPQEGDSFNTSKPNKRRFCERTMEDPTPARTQIQLVSPEDMLSMQVDQHAISVFESWLSEDTTTYPEDPEFRNFATLTKLDVSVVKSWFTERLRAQRTNDSPFETWLHEFPSAYPGDKEFESWAGLSKFSFDDVKLWFAQKLRCKAAPMPLSNELSTTGSGVIGAGPAFPTATSPQQPSIILQRAAAWVREEKEPKCEASLDRSLLLRDNHEPFQCTLKCGKKFRTRDSWRRHEEVNWPQKGWVCDLPASTVVAGIRTCTQCETPDPHMDHFETHKSAACCDQPFPRGLFYRKDHFSQHFRNVHPHVPWEDYERISHFSVESNFPRRCGFCTHTFLHWKDRVEHIGVHFHDEGKDMTEWNNHSEGDDESDSQGDDKHDDNDDDDRSPDDASDSSDDDSDDSPPRSAPKKRVQAGASRSGGQSSATAPGTSNQMLQPSIDPLEFEVSTSTPSKDQSRLRQPFQHSLRPLPPLRFRTDQMAGNASTYPGHDTAKFHDAIVTSRYLQLLSSSTSADPITQQYLSHRRDSDHYVQRRKSKDYVPLKRSFSDKVYDSALDRRTTGDHKLANGTSETSPEILKSPWWRIRPSLTRANPKQTRWLHLLFSLTVSLLTGLIVALSLYLKLKNNTITEATMPTPTMLPQTSNLPVADSSIGTAQLVIGTYFSTAASGMLQTKVVYNGGNGQICVRTESQNEWSNVQCLDGANPRADTPLTILDWLGGPSVYFITADNFLSGIDNMPVNDTWKFSTVRDQKRPTHPQSQLASVTWFNGTSSWLYYQDVNSQLREFGLDDYRDITWRDGSTGPLGLALTGTGIGTSRWWLPSDGSEVLEVFVQVSDGALGCLYLAAGEAVYRWAADSYPANDTWNTTSGISAHESMFDKNTRQLANPPEPKLTSWTKEAENTPLSEYTELDFVRTDVQHWWGDYLLIHGMWSNFTYEPTIFNDTHLLHKDGFVLLPDTASRIDPQWVIAQPDIMDDGNNTLIPDVFYKDGTYNISAQFTDTGSTILFRPIQSFDSHWSTLTISLGTLYFLLILFAVVSQILLLTYTTWVVHKILRNDPGTPDLYGFELVFTILLTLCYIAFLYLDKKDIGSNIATGCIFFATYQFLLLVSQSLREWRTYTSYLMIIALPILAVQFSIDIGLQWVLSLAAWVLPALMLNLIASRNSKPLRARETTKTDSHSSSKTIGNTCQVIIHLLVNPIDFFWNLMIRLQMVSSAKANYASLEDTRHEHLPSKDCRFRIRDGKLDHYHIGDNEDECLLRITNPDVEFILTIIAGNNLFPEKVLCWYLLARAHSTLNSITHTPTRRLYSSFGKPPPNKTFSIQCCSPKIRSTTFSIFGKMGNIVLGNQILRHNWGQYSALVISLVFIDRNILFGGVTFVCLTTIIVLEVLLVSRLIKGCVNSRREHQCPMSSAEVHSPIETKTVPRDFDIFGTCWEETMSHQTETSGEQSCKSSGRNVGVAGWGINPVADVGAWAEETTTADGYPLALSPMDLSMEVWRSNGEASTC